MGERDDSTTNYERPIDDLLNFYSTAGRIERASPHIAGNFGTTPTVLAAIRAFVCTQFRGIIPESGGDAWDFFLPHVQRSRPILSRYPEWIAAVPKLIFIEIYQFFSHSPRVDRAITS